MANTYTHRIISLKKADELYLNVVKSFVVETTVSDGTNQFSNQYTIKLESPEDVNGFSFTEYEDLQESDLVSWLTNNYIEIEFIKKDIDRKLKESLQDNVESNFPWS